MKYEIREVAPTPTPREVVLTCTQDELHVLEFAMYYSRYDKRYLSDSDRWTAVKEGVYQTLHEAWGRL